MKQVKLSRGWAWKPLASLVHPSRKISYGIVQPGVFDPNGILLVRGQDYSDGWAKPEAMFRVSEAIDAPYRRSRLKAGDIIMTIVGAGTGNIAIVPGYLEGANITQTTARIAVNEAVACRDFVRLVLESHIGRHEVYRNIKGGAQPGLNISDVEKFNIPTPALSEQTKIAATLMPWIEALDKLDALIAAEARRKQALLQQLITGNRRLPGFRKPWKHVKLSAVAEECSIRNRETLDRSRLYGVTKIDGMVPMRENVQGATINRCQIVERGWFAYNPMRINIGSIARWEHDDAVMVSPDYVVFRTNESLLLSDYLNHIRRTALWSDFVGAAGNGSVRIRIWFDDLGYFEFPLPPIEEQRAIAAVLDTADTELRLLRQQRSALDHQKRGLMQKLLTGTIRVNPQHP